MVRWADESSGGTPRSGRALRVALAAAVTVVATVCVAPASGYVRPGERDQVDRTPGGGESSWGKVGTTSLSANGRYVAFDTDASDLVPGDTNNAADIFVTDTATHRVTLVSHGLNGTGGVGASLCITTTCWGSPGRYLDTGLPNPNVGSWDPSMSQNGRYVAFTSTAVNLVTGHQRPGNADIYEADLRTGRISLVSVSSTGVQGDASSFLPSVSADGRFISFTSDATNLVTGDTNGTADVFVHDTWSGKTVRVSVSSAGAEGCVGTGCGNAALRLPFDLFAYAYPQSAISGNGRFVEFSDSACNLVANDTNCRAEWPDVFEHDMLTRVTTRISVASGGAEATFPPKSATQLFGYSGSTLAGDDLTVGWAAGQTVSNDGRYAVFSSTADNLVPNYSSSDPSQTGLGGIAEYVHDLLTGRTYRVDVQSDGQPAHLHDGIGEMTEYPTISGDGRVIAMFCDECQQTQPVPTGTVQLYDRVTGGVSVIPCAIGVKRSKTSAWNCDWTPQVSADGTRVSVTSHWSPTPPPAGFTDAAGAFVWNLSRALGAGAVVTTPTTRTETGADLAAMEGGRLLGATLASRAATNDVYVRLSVDRMGVGAASAGAPAGYALDLSVRGRRFELRAMPSLLDSTAAQGTVAAWSGSGSPTAPSADAWSFALLEGDSAGGWHPRAALSGGYGTTGPEIVVAIPLSALGTRDARQIRGATAFPLLLGR
jgi:hypothetical protein